jgi:hypothetical protein
MYHGIYGVDGIEVLVDQDIGLLFSGEYADDLGKTAATRPVVGKGVL